MPSIDLKNFKNKQFTASLSAEKPSGSLYELLNRDITFGSKELNDKKKEQLYLELSSLLTAGVNLKNSIDLVTADQQKEREKKLFAGIQENVLRGMPFSEALKVSEKFSTYEIYSLQIGEESGMLTEVLADLALFYKNKIKQRRKIMSALTYPCVVMATSVGAVFFMLKFVVPMFGDVFKRFGGELPWITGEIIKVSKSFEDYSGIVFLGLAGLSAGCYYFRKTQRFRSLVSGLVLRIPIAGQIVQKIYLTRFCNSMRLLINARLPLLRAIELTNKMVGFYPLENALEIIQTDVLQGEQLHRSLQRFKIFPQKMIQLLKIGEETNQLDHFFSRIAEQYIDEVEYQTSTISNLMEPLIIVFLGLIIGLILVAMYLPMFQMSNSFQG